MGGADADGAADAEGASANAKVVVSVTQNTRLSMSNAYLLAMGDLLPGKMSDLHGAVDADKDDVAVAPMFPEVVNHIL
jgi:hypothetical protein